MGGVRDKFIYQGREIGVTYLPQEVGELGGLCDTDWRSLALVFFSCIMIIVLCALMCCSLLAFSSITGMEGLGLSLRLLTISFVLVNTGVL